jgi:hypothetical protein
MGEAPPGTLRNFAAVSPGPRLTMAGLQQVRLCCVTTELMCAVEETFLGPQRLHLSRLVAGPEDYLKAAQSRDWTSTTPTA